MTTPQPFLLLFFSLKLERRVPFFFLVYEKLFCGSRAREKTFLMQKAAGLFQLDMASSRDAPRLPTVCLDGAECLASGNLRALPCAALAAFEVFQGARAVREP